MPAVTTTARYQAAVLALGGTAGAVKIQWSPAQRIKISLAPQQLHVLLPCDSSAAAATAPVCTDDTEALCSRACSLLHEKVSLLTSSDDSSLQAGLQKFISCPRNIQNQSQLVSFLHTAGTASVPVRYRSGSAIRVQLTAVARH